MVKQFDAASDSRMCVVPVRTGVRFLPGSGVASLEDGSICCCPHLTVRVIEHFRSRHERAFQNRQVMGLVRCWFRLGENDDGWTKT